MSFGNFVTAYMAGIKKIDAPIDIARKILPQEFPSAKSTIVTTYNTGIASADNNAIIRRNSNNSFPICRTIAVRRWD